MLWSSATCMALLLGLGGAWVWKRFTRERHRTEYIDHILESLGGSWCVWHAQDGLITWNATFQEELGLAQGTRPAWQNFLGLFQRDVRDALQKDLKYCAEARQPLQRACALQKRATLWEIKGYPFRKDQVLLWIEPSPDRTVSLEDLERDLQRERQKNQRFETILKHVPVIMWCQDRATQRLVFCSQSYADALEAPISEVLDRQILLFQDDPRHPSPPETHFHKHVIIAGERRLLDICQTQTEGYTVGYALDVTDLEHYQNELQRYFQAHQDVLELVSVPIAVYGPDERLQFFNTAYARLSGIDAYWLGQKPSFGEVLEELRARRRLPEFADFPAYKKKQLQYFTSMLEPIEELQHLPDERTIRMVIYPHPLGGLLFVFEDVTDKLSLERQYNTLIDVQQETLDHLYEGIVVFGSDNRLRLTNPAFGKLWGLNHKQLAPGVHLSTVVEAIKPYCHYGPDWDVFKMNIIASLTDRIPKSGRLERTDNSILSFSYVPLPDGGNLLSYFDVTDSTKVENALRDRNEALEKADQMKSEFIANISYELREPLNTIVGFTEILTNQYFGGLNDRQMEYSKAVLSSSQQLLSLINDLLDLASIEGGYFYLKKSFFDVFQMASSLMNQFQTKAEEKTITLALDCPKTIGLFWADETRIKQITFNLLKNSLNHTPQEGEVRLFFKKEEDFLLLRVTDTGVGIPSADLERIFEKFERIVVPHDKTYGAGLGLSLVRHLTQMHGGKVSIHSQEGRGTTVECWLPLQEEETQDLDHRTPLALHVPSKARLAATG